MKRIPGRRGSIRRLLTGLFTVAMGGQAAIAAEPAWWGIRSVKTGAPVADYSVANQGQAKWFAKQAEAELMEKLPPGFNGSILPTLPTGNNYLPINHGQLKNLVKPLYDRIKAARTVHPSVVVTFPQGMTMAEDYPWTTTTSDDLNYALVNLGQLKHSLSFEIIPHTDSDLDGLSDGWEIIWFGSIAAYDGGGADPDNDGLTNLQEYQLGLNPNVNQADQAPQRRNYAYDRLNRLDDVTGKSQVNLTLDKEGNITNVTP